MRSSELICQELVGLHEGFNLVFKALTGGSMSMLLLQQGSCCSGHISCILHDGVERGSSEAEAGA